MSKYCRKELIEKSKEYKFTLFIGFIDYEKSFDTVEKWAIEQALQNNRMDSRYIKLIKDMASDASATYYLHMETDKVPLERGIRQSGALLLKIFTVVTEDVFNK